MGGWILYTLPSQRVSVNHLSHNLRHWPHFRLMLTWREANDESWGGGIRPVENKRDYKSKQINFWDNSKFELHCRNGSNLKSGFLSLGSSHFVGHLVPNIIA